MPSDRSLKCCQILLVFANLINTVEVRLSGTRLTGKFDYPDLIEQKKKKIKGKKKKKHPEKLDVYQTERLQSTKSVKPAYKQVLMTSSCVRVVE